MTPQEKITQSFEKLNEVILSLLDKEKGCPWDKEQTAHTQTEYLIEECFELVDAIRSNKPGHVVDEMGDVLFIIAFIAHRYSEEGKFDLADAFNAGAEKMIRRHPHVFSDAKFTTKDELIESWNNIKKQEKAAAKEEQKGVFGSLVRNLPPLTKAYRIHSKAAQAGFTWESDEDVEQQVEAEWLELYDAMQTRNPEAIEHELGDMIFSLIELGRRKGIKAAIATDNAANRFLNRFEKMEALAQSRNMAFDELSLEEKDELWQEAKALLSK